MFRDICIKTETRWLSEPCCVSCEHGWQTAMQTHGGGEGAVYLYAATRSNHVCFLFRSLIPHLSDKTKSLTKHIRPHFYLLSLPSWQVNFVIRIDTLGLRETFGAFFAFFWWTETSVTVSTRLDSRLPFFIYFFPLTSLRWQLWFCRCEALSCYRDPQFHVLLFLREWCECCKHCI